MIYKVKETMDHIFCHNIWTTDLIKHKTQKGYLTSLEPFKSFSLPKQKVETPNSSNGLTYSRMWDAPEQSLLKDRS